MQVVPGVYLVNGFPYRVHQNTYVIRAGDALVLVDSGDLGSDVFPILERNCARYGIALTDISHMLVTHAHYDHASHAARLQRLGAKIVASADTADAMAAGDDRCIPYAVSQPFEPCETDVVVEDGQDLAIGDLTVRCIAAPGHTNGLVIYEIVLNGERLWFCGDLVEIGAECQSLQLGWAGGPDYDRPTYLETLRKLAHMELDTLLPGHGPPAIGCGKAMIDMAYTKAMVDWR